MLLFYQIVIPNACDLMVVNPSNSSGERKSQEKEEAKK